MSTTKNQRPFEIRRYDFLIIDIVAYSTLPGEEQVAAIERLTKVVRASEAIRTTKNGGERIFLPTGDGMVIGFIGRPTKPLDLAVEIHRSYGADRMKLKIGIQAGMAFAIEDINGAPNVAGSGINMAARVLSCCKGGHILVAQEPAEELKKDYGAWRETLVGPYEFVVKHGLPLVAYNLTGPGFGNPDESFNNMFFKGGYARLKSRLAKRGIAASAGLATFASATTESLVIDEVIVDLPIVGYKGLSPDKVLIKTSNRPLDLPEYVSDAKALLSPAPMNRPKLFLTHETPPISDRDARLVLELAYSDFQTSRAIEQCLANLQEGILEGQPHLSDFPRRLDCPIVLITADQKLVITRRAASDVVRYFPLTWEVSVGESMDAEHDVGSGGVHPVLTVQRGLVEELGMPATVAESARITFAAIATEWRILAANLIAVVQLPEVESDELRDWFPSAIDREHTHIDMIAFHEPEPALQVFYAGTYACEGAPSTYGKLNDISRVSLLTALFNVFGYQRILALI
ncbi:MAG: hypothetical protein QOC81_3494 [Thermoanaerobaculia bacterium]|jgi:hypothetical protein|nr:hypothetical protein [Thermoanaerobaculia bacterium]